METQIVIPILVLLGAGVMLVSVVKASKILQLLQSYQELKPWQALYALTIFFLGGYLLAIYLTLTERDRLVAWLMGIVFFSGSLFVLISINLFYHTLFITQEDYRRAKQEAESALHRLKYMQSQLIHNEKMLSLERIAASVAHEINNPITFISGNLHHLEQYSHTLIETIQLYQERCPQLQSQFAEANDVAELEFLQSDLPRLIHSMRSGAERIRRIVELLCRFSGLDEAQRKTIDLRDAIESTVGIFRGYQKARYSVPIEVVTEYNTLPLVECNPKEINQALVNLLVNAADAIEAKGKQHQGRPGNPFSGRIDLRAIALNQQRVQITIADNGIGIAEADRGRIFEPFFSTKLSGQGTGLGLAIAYQIVVGKHRGTLVCDSTPGQGTQFVIELPAHL